jgi:hypothetical protein
MPHLRKYFLGALNGIKEVRGMYDMFDRFACSGGLR